MNHEHSHEYMHENSIPHEHPHTHHHDHEHAHDSEHAHSHDHDHNHEHAHSHDHGHDHCDSAEGCANCSGCSIDPRAELLALMKYTINHNTAHAGELATLAKQLQDMGDKMAYEQVMQAVSDFEKGNMRLATVLAALNVPQ